MQFNTQPHPARYKLSKFQKLLLPLMFSAAAIAASTQASARGEREILEAESFQYTFKANSPRLFKRSAEDESPMTQMEFDAYGQTFLLNLYENTRFRSKLQGRSSAVTFKGNIEGIADSWVRLTSHNGVMTGAIFDGVELFIIDQTQVVEPEMSKWLKRDFSKNKSKEVIYRMSDTMDTAACGAEEATAKAAAKQASYKKLVEELQEQAAEEYPMALAAEKRVNVTVVADTQYVASSNGDVDGQVISQMNVVDGIFSEQVGVQFYIDRIIPLSNNGPLTSTDAGTLLGQFNSYVNSNVGNSGLAHLFSGKEFDGNVIGVAYMRAVCTGHGTGTSQMGNRGVYGALTAAHEFGHNMGAPHDNQSGSACSSTPGSYLMNPGLNGSDQFSQCSINQMAPVVASASCLDDISGPTPTPTPTPTVTPPPGNGVTLYQHCNYGGYSATLDVGNYSISQLNGLGIRDNDISSVRVPEGYIIEMFNGNNQTGTVVSKDSDDTCLVNDNFNDQLTSVRVSKENTEVATLFQHCNYGGYGVALEVGEYTLADLQAMGISNDDVSSLSVSAGYKVELFQHYNFTGNVVTVTADDSCLVNDGFNDELSSVRVSPL
ncbi:Development-specific protein S [Thalassocella blandensis]|nr:Development-specific protein S [Thalassocella blandensis]